MKRKHLILFSLKLSFAIGEMIISPVDMNGAELPIDASILPELYVKAYDNPNSRVVKSKCKRINEITEAPESYKFLMKVEQSYTLKFEQNDEIYNKFSVVRNFFCIDEDDIDPEKKYYPLRIYSYEMPRDTDQRVLTISCRIKRDDEDNELSLHSIGQIEQLQDGIGKFARDIHWRSGSGMWKALRDYITFAKRTQCEYATSDPEGDLGLQAKTNFQNFEGGHFTDIQEQSLATCTDEDISDEEFETVVKTLLPPVKNRIKLERTSINNIMFKTFTQSITHFIFYYDHESFPMCIDTEKLLYTIQSERGVPSTDPEEILLVFPNIVNMMRDPNQNSFSVNFINCIIHEETYTQFTFSDIFLEDSQEYIGYAEIFNELSPVSSGNVLHESYFTECPKAPTKNTVEKNIDQTELPNILENDDIFIGYLNDDILRCFRVDNILRYEDQIYQILTCKTSQEDVNLCLCNQGISVVKQFDVISTSTGAIYKELTPKSGSVISTTHTHTVQFKPIKKNEQRAVENISPYDLSNMLEDEYFLIFNEEPICHNTVDFKIYIEYLTTNDDKSSPEHNLSKNELEIMQFLTKRNNIFSTSLGNCLKTNSVKKVQQFQVEMQVHQNPPVENLHTIFQLLPSTTDPVIHEDEFICNDQCQ